MQQKLTQEAQRKTRTDSRLLWIAAMGLATAVGIAYFFAAQLSLEFLAKPDGVAVFWPAAGVSSGVLIALRRDARLPVAAGAMVATIIANLMGDRNVWGATAFALCNAGARQGIRVNVYLIWRISSRNLGSQPALLRRVLTLPLRLLARTRPRAKRRTMAMFLAPCPVR